MSADEVIGLLFEAANWIRQDHGYRQDERGAQSLVARLEGAALEINAFEDGDS